MLFKAPVFKKNKPDPDGESNAHFQAHLTIKQGRRNMMHFKN